MALPNFLVIGAAKCGTTSVHTYLDRHQQVFMSRVKEPRFFAVQGDEPGLREWIASHPSWVGTVTTLEAYEDLFRDVTGEIAIGETSPVYLERSEPSAEAIARHLPEAKLIAILRHPIERAFSHYKHHLRLGEEPHDSFEAAIESRLGRQVYVERSKYAQQLRPFLQRFPRQNLHVCLYNDLCGNPHGLMRDIFMFLGVDPDHPIEVGERFNVSERLLARPNTVTALMREDSFGKRLGRALLPGPIRRVLRGTIQQANSFEPQLTPQTRRKLCEEFREDVQELQSMLGRDLSFWLA